MSDELVKRAPDVITSAQPDGKLLLRVRAKIQSNRALADVFASSQTADEIVDRLTPLLRELFPFDHDDIADAARYLADEYAQVGTGILLISHETGRAIGRITEDDLYQPPPVPREDGQMVQRPMKMLPQVEGFLIQWNFDRVREQEIRADIERRLPRTELVAEEGDRRLLFYTGEGRKQLVEMLRQSLPTLLQKSPLAKAFKVVDETPEGLQPGLKCKAFARVSLPMVDIRYRNVMNDPLSMAEALVLSRWTCEIGRVLSLDAEREGVERRPYGPVQGAEMWVASPPVAWRLRSGFDSEPTYYPKANVLTVDGAVTTAIIGDGDNHGHIVVNPRSIEMRSREIFDRWEIAATVEFTLYVDWTKVRAVEFTDIATEFAAVLY